MSDQTRAGARDPLLSPSEMEFRQRVRDLEAAAYDYRLACLRMHNLGNAMQAETACLRRAIRVLAKMQRDARVRDAVMEVLSNAR